MSKKDELEKDYKKFNMTIKRVAEREIKKIQEKTDAIKEEADKMGEAVELSLSEREEKAVKKKVNT
jgi:hypothetical protein